MKQLLCIVSRIFEFTLYFLIPSSVTPCHKYLTPLHLSSLSFLLLKLAFSLQIWKEHFEQDLFFDALRYAITPLVPVD